MGHREKGDPKVLGHLNPDEPLDWGHKTGIHNEKAGILRAGKGLVNCNLSFPVVQ